MALLIFFYTALTVFVAGNLYRIVRVARTPAHLRWELYPIPHGSREKQAYGGSYFEDSNWWTSPPKHGRIGELLYMAKEILLLKSVRESNPALWLCSWLFHLGMYAWTVSAVLTIGVIAALIPDSDLAAILFMGASTAFGAAMLLGSAGTIGLIALRYASPRLRPFTSRAAVLNLALIMGIFCTGVAMLLHNPGSLEDVIEWLASPVLYPRVPRLPVLASAHVALVSLFLLYFPFSHMTHAYMKFFTYHSVRWDDAPSALNPRAGASIARSLQQPVTWAAPHIAGDGAVTWAEVISGGAQADKHDD